LLELAQLFLVGLGGFVSHGSGRGSLRPARCGWGWARAGRGLSLAGRAGAGAGRSGSGGVGAGPDEPWAAPIPAAAGPAGPVKNVRTIGCAGFVCTFSALRERNVHGDEAGC